MNICQLDISCGKKAKCCWNNFEISEQKTNSIISNIPIIKPNLIIAFKGN